MFTTVNKFFLENNKKILAGGFFCSATVLPAMAKPPIKSGEKIRFSFGWQTCTVRRPLAETAIGAVKIDLTYGT